MVKAEKNFTPLCKVYRKCGGCQMQNMSYERQKIWKQNKVGEFLSRYGRVEPIIGMENPFHYRGKVQAAFCTARGGKIISGVYQSGSHRVVWVDSCLIEDQTADRVILTIRQLLKSFKIKPYDENTGYGVLRHVLIRRGFATNDVMVVLVSATPIFPAVNNFAKAIVKEHPEVKTVVLNVNRRHTSMVLGDSSKTVYGKGYITDVLCGHTFRISPGSFFQVNPVQTEILYGKAMEFADLSKNEKVLDAYCGIGTIALTAAEYCNHVTGVELVSTAVRDAKINASLNKITNAEFIVGDAGDYMDAAVEAGIHFDTVFMDPPRSGSSEKFLLSTVSLAPKKIVYISCNPETQARDLETLTKNGYTVKRIVPVDMFPHTHHVETVVLLLRK